MTLVVALCTRDYEHEGLLITSDSQATLGPVTYGVRKIMPIGIAETPLAVASGAGDVALIKKAVRVSSEILTMKSVNQWNRRTPSFDQFEESINEIESALIQKSQVTKIKD